MSEDAGVNCGTTIHQEITQELSLALKRTKLLPRLREFRSLVSCSSSAGREFHYYADERARLMVRVKSASELFVDLLSSLSDEKKSYLKTMGLYELLEKRTWLWLLIECQRKKPATLCIDSVYRRLSRLEELPVGVEVGVEASQSALLAPEQTLSEARQHEVSGYRSCAWAAYLCGLLTIAGLAFSFSAVTSDVLETFYSFSQSHEIVYRSLLALLVLSLCVTAFRLLTRVVSPATGTPAVERSRANTGLFEYRVSFRRAFTGCAGPLILGFGTGISVSAGFGTFGLTVLLDGIHASYGVPFWVSQLLMSVSCYGLAWKWARIPLGIGTVPSLLLIGPAISFGATVAPADLAFIGNLCAFVLGTLIFAFGIAMTAAAALGPDGVTALSLAAEQEECWPIPRSTFFFNISAIAIGIVLAGNFGVATVLNLVAVPILLHYQVPWVRRWLESKPLAGTGLVAHR